MRGWRLIAILPAVLLAQYSEWQAFTNNDRINQVAVRGDSVWVATPAGAVAVNILTNAKTILNIQNSGLPGSRVRALARDSAGNLWAGTDQGLARFDGVDTWKVFNTANSGLLVNYIKALAVDPQGRKWIGTEGGGVTVCNQCGETGIEGKVTPQLGTGIELEVRPNPFKSTVSFELSTLQSPTADGRAASKDKIPDLFIYSSSGKCVARLAAHRSPLTASYTWNASSRASGIYFCRLQIGGNVATRRIVRLK
jgi:hypothetical protein